MALIEIRHLKHYFGDRLILDIDHLSIHSNDRIGIVGRNGIGKTTLLNIISGILEPDEGIVQRHGYIGYVSQLNTPHKTQISPEFASRFNITPTYNEQMSGGEKTRFKIAAVLEDKPLLLILDEPTSNLDIDGIRCLEDVLSNSSGAIVIVSHDRQLLDHVCTEIIDIDEGTIKRYKGNYSNYYQQKCDAIERQYEEYEAYTKEKQRLTRIIQRTKEKKQGIRKTPKRMGNSEARRLKMSSQKATGSLERFIKSVESRLNKMERKEKPMEHKPIHFDLTIHQPIHSRVIIEGKRINKSFGDLMLFRNASFQLENGKKIALIGPNGCGKSTLIKMIMNKHPNIYQAPALKISYFSQQLDLLDPNRTIFDNVMETSIYPETFVRILLARLRFRGDSILKPVNVLSGGERVKASFAKLLVQDSNCLILDEPTNYLDIESMEALEEALLVYPQTILLVTHDRRLIQNVANELWFIHDKQIHVFKGDYQSYIEEQKRKQNDFDHSTQKQILLLETKLSEIISKLSLPSPGDSIDQLNAEYERILNELRQLKKK